MPPSNESQRISLGIPGLDEILDGGLTPHSLYLIEGTPGAGKTTLALQFLLEGVKKGESTLYVTLSETRGELLGIAASHGWSLEKVHLYEMATEDTLTPEQQMTMFHPSELELSETTKEVLNEVEKYKPRRVVFDSLSEMRLLAQNPLRYRRQILALKQFFAGRQSTVLMLDDRTAPGEDLQLQSIAHGVISLDRLATEYGAERRQLRITKMRGMAYKSGLHDFVIRRGGLQVFPRLVAAGHVTENAGAEMASGVAELDELLCGGLTRGTSTLLIGPAGCGKSTVATQFCVQAARNGERSAIFHFDETIQIMKARSRQLGLPTDEYFSQGLMTGQQINSAELSPGEFASIVRSAVDGRDANGRPAKVVVIDSVNGYFNSMSQEKQLSSQLHELFTCLNQLGVITLVTVTQSGMVGPMMHTPIDMTYLADNVILFRYFESFGRVRRAISVVKKRCGKHEPTIRELDMDHTGLIIGEPLDQFQGVLSGIPTFHGKVDQLLKGKPGNAE
jgi:circadian clock protein KaiC